MIARPYIKATLFLVFLSGAVLSPAQTVKRDLLKRFTPDIVTKSLIPHGSWAPFRVADGWQKQLPESMVQKLIRQGEASLNTSFEPIPATVTLEYIRIGDRDNYQAISFNKRKRLWDLVMAEAVEGQGRFTDQIMNGVWSICEESFWGVPAHIHYQKAGDGLPDIEDPIIDLFAAETATVLAFTDYFAGAALDKLSPLIRRRIYHEVNRRVLTPMLTAEYYWLGLKTPDKKVANWAPWVMSNYIASSLLLEKDESKRAGVVSYALKVVDHYINSLGEDGSTEEGPSYWFAAAGTVYDSLDLLHDATRGKINIYNHPFIQKTGSYIYNMHIAGRYFFNVGDADPKLVPNGLMFYRFGQAVGDPKMIQFGIWAHQAFEQEGLEQNWHRMRLLYNYKVLKEVSALPPAKYEGIPQAWMSDVQVLVARSTNGLFVAAHGGHNAESHNHNDVGDFIVYNNGEPVIIDVGRGTYTYKMFRGDRYSIWFNNSAYHNLPTINGHVQPNGRTAEATEVTHQVSAAGDVELTMNIGTAYPKAAGINRWERKVSMTRNNGIVVQDAFQMQEPLKSLTQSFMTVCTASTDEPGVVRFQTATGNVTFMKYDASGWEVTKEKMALTAPEDKKLKSSWDGRDIWRILFTAKSQPREGQHTFVFYK